MTGRALLGRCVGLVMATALAAPAGGACLLCTAPPGDVATPVEATEDLRIDISHGLRFERVVAQGGRGGEIVVDPQSGASSARGGAIELGMAVSGRIRITGEPGRAVRIELPREVGMLSSGGRLSLRGISTDLPPRPRLGADGALEFNIGGTLALPAGAAPGDYRAQIAISADYE